MTFYCEISFHCTLFQIKHNFIQNYIELYFLLGKLFLFKTAHSGNTIVKVCFEKHILYFSYILKLTDYIFVRKAPYC